MSRFTLLAVNSNCGDWVNVAAPGYAVYSIRRGVDCGLERHWVLWTPCMADQALHPRLGIGI